MAVDATIFIITNKIGFELLNEQVGVGRPSQEMICLGYIKLAVE